LTVQYSTFTVGLKLGHGRRATSIPGFGRPISGTSSMLIPILLQIYARVHVKYRGTICRATAGSTVSRIIALCTSVMG
jgi:hypothetical protein